MNKITSTTFTRPILLLGISLLAFFNGTLHANAAITYNFDTDAQYDDNFVELPAAGTASIYRTTISAGPVLIKKDSGAQSVIYDTSATGGSGGTGGTSGSGADLYINSEVSMGFRSSFTTANNSLGLYSRVSSDYTAGYLGLVNYTSTGLRLRIFDSNSNPLASSVGTTLEDNSVTVSLSGSTFYTISFNTMNTVDDNVSLFLSVLDTDSSVIASISVTDTTSPVLSEGQIGFRAANSTTYMDDFTVVPTVVPEPSIYAFLLSAVIFLCALNRKNRKEAN